MNLPQFLSQDEDGEIRLTGHRIGLYTVVRYLKHGHSAEQITEAFPSLPLELVKQVIGFYRENVADMDAYVAKYRAELERQAANPPGPGVVQVRRLMELLQRADADHAAEPGWSNLPFQEKLRRLEQANRTAPV